MTEKKWLGEASLSVWVKDGALWLSRPLCVWLSFCSFQSSLVKDTETIVLSLALFLYLSIYLSIYLLSN